MQVHPGEPYYQCGRAWERKYCERCQDINVIKTDWSGLRLLRRNGCRCCRRCQANRKQRRGQVSHQSY